MREVRLRVRVAGATADECFGRIADFARYPDLVDVVRSVTVHPVLAGEPEHSDWEVYFRNGILRWSESDELDRSRMVIGFAQIDGDFEEFTGRWRIEPVAGGCDVYFGAEFDFGIPSLAGILDPIAERVFKETIARVLAGLFDRVEVLDDEATAAALARHAPAASGAR
jgi:ribosome-associated toxin RatA of RatAB toxin-antitoxin module